MSLVSELKRRNVIRVAAAYVVAAFVAGSQLSKIQLSIVNFSFLTAATMFGYIAVTAYRRFYTLILLDESVEPVPTKNSIRE